jgi:hypothetical protein
MNTEVIMKKIMKLTVASIVAVFISLPLVPAKAISVDEAVQKVIDTVVDKASSSSDFTSKLCRKANFFSSTYSIRSGEGIACNNKYVAALAEVLCTPGNPDDYAKSHCHANAMKVLGTQKPEDVLKAAVKSGISQAKNLVCKKKDKLPAQLQSAAAACAA